MPILGRTPEAAAKKHFEAFNALLRATLTQSPLVMVKRPKSRGAPPEFHSAFCGKRETVDVPLKTRFGTVGLSVGQRCGIVRDKKTHRLFTLEYRYMLTPEGADQPLGRWEYVREPETTARWCRDHLPGTPAFALGKRAVALNVLHLPSGFVTLEEVLRCCVVDLEVKPLSPAWNEKLETSDRRFQADRSDRDALVTGCVDGAPAGVQSLRLLALRSPARRPSQRAEA